MLHKQHIRRGFLSELCDFFDRGVCSLFYRLVKLSSMRRYSLIRRESNQFINGFGTEMHSSSTLEGHLFGGSIGYSIEEGKWGQYLLNSGDSNLLIVPDSKRIFSLSCLRRQGHFILETGPNPGFIVMPQKIYFPFKEADNGLLYFPILPSPVKIDNVYSHFYREGRLEVLNLQEKASEVYQVNSGERSSDGSQLKEKKNTARKATRSALSKSDFRSKFNRAKALIRKCKKKRTIGRKRHKVTSQKRSDSRFGRTSSCWLSRC